MANPPIEVPPTLTIDQALERARRGSAAPLLATWHVAAARVSALEPPLQERLELTLSRVVAGPVPLTVLTEVAFPLRPDEPTDPDLSDVVADFTTRFEALLAELLADGDAVAWLKAASSPRAVFDPLGANLRGRFLLAAHAPDGAHLSRIFPE